MSNHGQDLLDAFRNDHAVLGHGFARLSAALRAGDLAAAREAARALDQSAGAHIAFEEEDFYPRLRETMSAEEVERLYHDHGTAFAVIERLCALKPEDALSNEETAALVAGSEEMERHIAECGELFQAMTGLSPDQQVKLLARLQRWRDRAPTWHAVRGE